MTEWTPQVLETEDVKIIREMMTGGQRIPTRSAAGTASSLEMGEGGRESEGDRDGDRGLAKAGDDKSSPRFSSVFSCKEISAK
jgi:hypothetical protein